MRSSFFPKCKPKITRISALPNKQGSQQFLWWFFGEYRQFFWLWSLFVGQKFLVCSLGETMTSSIHSEFNWPLEGNLWKRKTRKKKKKIQRGLEKGPAASMFWVQLTSNRKFAFNRFALSEFLRNCWRPDIFFDPKK